MSIARTLQDYLDRNELQYNLVKHPYAEESLKVAEQAHLEPEKMVKCVMLEDEGGYVMAVCQASMRIQLGTLYREINRRLEFAEEHELADVLYDCVLGAIPPVGELYDVEVVIDDGLLNQDEMYFEAGDHEDLIHVSAETFQEIMRGADHASFCIPANMH